MMLFGLSVTLIPDLLNVLQQKARKMHATFSVHGEVNSEMAQITSVPDFFFFFLLFFGVEFQYIVKAIVFMKKYGATYKAFLLTVNQWWRQDFF